MAEYTLKNMDDDFWYRVKLMAAIRRMSIKDMIIKRLEQDLKNWSGQVDLRKQEVYE